MKTLVGDKNWHTRIFHPIQYMLKDKVKKYTNSLKRHNLNHMSLHLSDQSNASLFL
jgi:N-acetyl-beta-hexosaminidase